MSMPSTPQRRRCHPPPILVAIRHLRVQRSISSYPTDHSYLSPTSVIRFGLIGMGVAPAGFEKANTGHHHLLIDANLPPFDQPIPNDFNHLHFGAGQTEAKITLPLGQHKLQLILGDEDHVPHDPPDLL